MSQTHEAESKVETEQGSDVSNPPSTRDTLPPARPQLQSLPNSIIKGDQVFNFTSQ